MTNQAISLLKLLEEYQASNLNYKLPVVLGKNADGKAIFADLVELEHILMAGATGSGKSVFELSIIATFTKLFSPNQLRFFLVDMKRVEYFLPKNSSHSTPVIFDFDEVYEMLKWIKKEKNNRLKSNKLELETLPYIIVVIDTFSDLILHNSAEFQKQITETTKNAAKVKIHFIMSDSRCCPVNYTPSIKASFPTKICFNTASVVDSKTLIGVGDAVNLKGKGDMLLLYPKKKQTIRLQAPFISREEVDKITNRKIREKIIIMDITELKNEALVVDDLLTQYIELHNNFLKSAGAFSSLFKKVNFRKLAGNIYFLFEKFRDEKSKLDVLYKQSVGEKEKEFAKCLFLYTKALTETVHLLFIQAHALKEKAEGNKLSFQEHMENSKKYNESIQAYMKYGEELNNLYQTL